MSVAKNSVPLLQAVRRIGTSELRQSQSQTFLKLKAKQDKFQVADGTPVHLKGGVTDKLMYQGTMGLCLVGLGMIGKLLFDLSFPKKN